MNNTFKDNLYKLLKKDSRLWDEKTKEFNETLLKDLIDKLDKKLIELLLSNKETKEKFFIKIKDVFVLKQNELKFFIDESKLDNSYTQYKNKIGLRVGNKLLSERDEVVLDWPFKDCVLEGGMTKEDQKRNEIFFNEVLAKDEIDRLFDLKALKNWKRYTAKGEEKVKEIKRDKDGTIKENLIIKGNNLLALHSLKEQFAGKVKLIYIDPPYNTGTDSFGYNDNFLHSTWLVFMRNRLNIAKKFLKTDGVIFVQCDDGEQAYLKILLDEIFGRNNFVVNICIETSSINGLRTNNNKPTKVKDYILIYQLGKNGGWYKPQFQPDNEISHYQYYVEKKGNDSTKWEVKKLDKIILGHFKVKNIEDIPTNKLFNFYLKNQDKIYSSQPVADRLDRKAFAQKNPDVVRIYKNPDGSELLMYKKRILDPFKNKFKYIDGENMPTKLVGDLWTDISYTGILKEGGVVLKNGKKPEKLLKRIIEMSTNKEDIVLDYQAGSGTTLAVAHKTDRQYIGIEQLDYEENNPEERLKNVINGDQSGISKSVNWKGGGDFVYFELAKWNEEAKERILKAKNLEELEKLFDELYERYFLNYNVKTKEFKEKTLKEEGFKKLSLDEQKKLFVEMLDMNQMYVNFSERADKKYKLSKEDVALSEEFYNKK